MNISLYFLNYTFFFKMIFISIIIGGVLFALNFTQAQTTGQALVICPEATFSSVYEGSPEQFHAWYYPPTSTVSARCDLLRIGQGGATRVTNMASWSAQSRLNFPGFTVNNGLVTVTNVNGDFPVLQVQYGGLTAQRSLTLRSSTAPPPSVPLQVDLTANPTSVIDGGSVALSWTVNGSPSTCIASGGWSGSKGVSGGNENATVRFGMGVSQTFILTCYRGSESKQDTVSVTRISPPPPIPTLTFTASGYSQSGGNISIPVGAFAYLHWSASNVTSCIASNAWSGTKSLKDSEQVFGDCGRSNHTLTCSGPYGSITKTVGIMRWGCEPSTISVDLASDKGIVPEGGRIALTWTTSGNPDSCMASDGWSGSRVVGGGTENQTVSFGGGASQVFTLTCFKAGLDPVVDSVSIAKEIVAGVKDLIIKRNTCTGSFVQFNLGINEYASLVACDEVTNAQVSANWVTANTACISLESSNPFTTMTIKAVGDSACSPTNITASAMGYREDSISVGISGNDPIFPSPKPTESSTWKEIAP